MHHRDKNTGLYDEVDIRSNQEAIDKGYSLTISFIDNRKCFRLSPVHPQGTNVEDLWNSFGDKLYTLGVRVKYFHVDAYLYLTISSPGQPINVRGFESIVISPSKPGERVVKIQQIASNHPPGSPCKTYPQNQSPDACRLECVRTEMMKKGVLSMDGIHSPQDNGTSAFDYKKTKKLLNGSQYQFITRYCMEEQCPLQSCKDLRWKLSLGHQKAQIYNELMDIHFQVPDLASTPSDQNGLTAFFVDMFNSFGVKVVWCVIVIAVWLEWVIFCHRQFKQQMVAVSPAQQQPDSDEEDEPV